MVSASTTLAEYLDTQFQRDVETFSQGKASALQLCPLTLPRLLNSASFESIHNKDNFVAAVYAHNLLAQALHCYFRDKFLAWEQHRPPYPSVLGCLSHAFGEGGSRPIDFVLVLRRYGVEVKPRLLALMFFRLVENQNGAIKYADLVSELINDSDLERCEKVALQRAEREESNASAY